MADLTVLVVAEDELPELIILTPVTNSVVPLQLT